MPGAQAQAFVLPAFLIFCRLGACLMVMPVFSSSRLPVRVRLFLAVGLSLALTPLLGEPIRLMLASRTQAGILLAGAGELAIGGMIGLLARCFFLALQALMSAAAQAVGLATPAGMVAEEEGQLPEIATLLTLCASTLLLITGQHWELLRALVDSYTRLPPGGTFQAGGALGLYVDRLADTFLLALRLASPFLIYSMVVNFAVGLTNKLVPQIPVYFIATPIVTAGGLFLLYLVGDELLTMFTTAFAQWLAVG
ncbi:flagellar type III secretion system protein FliR [Starkeya koreensis]|uniref:Flagellar type III secretion system protein FliR n=1 Tax=Ancylobacter koreensis TaxID=266121 RepID=A0ABT0DKX0_9HYPH|nr:flagellar biosynthetic protein FliR [Ancylobacter koreensis]MCK0207929.1 flagellar type III secretion system protein FliR [Ancylobacter koreensis]